MVFTSVKATALVFVLCYQEQWPSASTDVQNRLYFSFEKEFMVLYSKFLTYFLKGNKSEEVDPNFVVHFCSPTYLTCFGHYTLVGLIPFSSPLSCVCYSLKFRIISSHRRNCKNQKIDFFFGKIFLLIFVPHDCGFHQLFTRMWLIQIKQPELGNATGMAALFLKGCREGQKKFFHVLSECRH